MGQRNAGDESGGTDGLFVPSFSWCGNSFAMEHEAGAMRNGRGLKAGRQLGWTRGFTRSLENGTRWNGSLPGWMGVHASLTCRQAHGMKDEGVFQCAGELEVRPHASRYRFRQVFVYPRNPRGYEVCAMGGSAKLRQQLQDGRKPGHLKDLLVMLTSRWAYGRCSWMSIGVTLRLRE
jgi:hypothetical protein